MKNTIKRAHVHFPADWEHVESGGVGGFTSRVVHRLADGVTHVWTSRRHRKGRGPVLIPAPDTVPSPPPVARRNPWLTFWAPERLTWWVATNFAIGSVLFALGAAMGLFPAAFGSAAADAMVINWTFAIGSVFFTAAGYMQLLEAINQEENVGVEERGAVEERGVVTEDLPRTKFRWFAWQPTRLGYLASLIQFAGTILFNFNTFDALLPGLGWVEEDVLIWSPDMIGSVCFLMASFLAFFEVCHGYCRWEPKNVSWWITVINLLGSIGFMVSAVFAIVLPSPADPFDLWIVNFFTLQGAICFLIGAYLLVPEMFSE